VIIASSSPLTPRKVQIEAITNEINEMILIFWWSGFISESIDILTIT
jgi:hypothetical protein